MKLPVEKSTLMGWAAIAVPLVVALVKATTNVDVLKTQGVIEAIGGIYDAIAYIVSTVAGYISVFKAKDK